jgi:hypothetical protein
MERKNIGEEEKTLEAIRTLKAELRQLLGPEEAEQLNRLLDQYLEEARSPERRESALGNALQAIKKHPRVRARLEEILGQKGVEEPHRLFEPLPGGEEVIPPGTVMVCPVDPSHYRMRLQFVGQRLRCPEHKVDLVPEERSGD